MSEELTGNDIIGFRTPDEAAQFLFWFGRSGNREQIDERVIREIQKEGNEQYRKEVARAATNFLEDRVNGALEKLGGKRQMYTYDAMMTALVIFYLQDRREALRDMDPDLLADIRQRADEFLEEYNGLKDDVKAAEDAYDRLEEDHSHCPKSILAAELFELFNRDLVNADVHVFRSQEPEPITDVSFGDAEGTIAIAFADRTTEYFKQRESVWVQLKDKPTPSRLETVKEWLITFMGDGQPHATALFTYQDARGWLMRNTDNLKLQPIYVYRQGERGHMTMMDSHSFFDNEEYYTR